MAAMVCSRGAAFTSSIVLGPRTPSTAAPTAACRILIARPLPLLTDIENDVGNSIRQFVGARGQVVIVIINILGLFFRQASNIDVGVRRLVDSVFGQTARIIGIFLGNDVALPVPHDLPRQDKVHHSFESFIACHIKRRQVLSQEQGSGVRPRRQMASLRSVHRGC